MSNDCIFTFVLGAVIGAGVTYLCMKGKVDVEISNVRESLSEQISEKEEKTAPHIEEKKDIFEVADEILTKNSYSYSNPVKEKFYTVESDIAGEDGYDLIKFVYHRDGIITDEDNNPVNNVPLHLGINYLPMIKDCKRDFVYIRNEDQKTDYQIEISDKEYSYIDEEPHKIGKRHIDYDDYYEDEEE